MNENQLEAAITEYLGVVLPDDCVAFHIPNAGRRKATAIAEMKRAGLLPGMPDRGIVYRGKVYFLEAKRPYIKGVQRAGVCSNAQAWVQHLLWCAGSKVEIVRSLEDVQAALDKFGIPLKQRVFP
jgi:hypothetical protein